MSVRHLKYLLTGIALFALAVVSGVSVYGLILGIVWFFKHYTAMGWVLVALGGAYGYGRMMVEQEQYIREGEQLTDDDEESMV